MANEVNNKIFCLLFFGLLSSSLLFLIVTQHFSCCILRSSSGNPSLSGYRNDLTWEITFKFRRLNHFHTQINKRHPKKTGGDSDRNFLLQITTIKRKKKCPWCNGYRRRKWRRRHEFTSWTRLIEFHIALIHLGKVWIQLFSLQIWLNSRAV